MFIIFPIAMMKNKNCRYTWHHSTPLQKYNMWQGHSSESVFDKQVHMYAEKNVLLSILGLSNTLFLCDIFVSGVAKAKNEIHQHDGSNVESWGNIGELRKSVSGEGCMVLNWYNILHEVCSQFCLSWHGYTISSCEIHIIRWPIFFRAS